MSNIRLRPDLPVPIVRDTKALLVPNRKGVKIYRACGKLPYNKCSPRFRDVMHMPRKQEYARKNKRLKIYQICHDEISLANCIDNEYITRLSLNPDLKPDDRPLELLGDVKHKTNQISESRAFLHYDLHRTKHDYIGFTSHKHNRKFFTNDRAICVSDINIDLVDKVFVGHPEVKLLAFRVHPAYDFIDNVKIAGVKGVGRFLFGFFKDCYHFDRESYQNLLTCMNGKIVPYCNCFIGNKLEIRDYISFLKDFLDWADTTHGFDKILLEVNRGHKSYDPKRGWGYICEQLIWYYLVFRYGKGFMTAFIDEHGVIAYHDRVGYGIKG